MNNKNYCVIMAGGIGSRFWPMSRTSFPKQFHDILGVGRTLIQMTYDRFLRICPKENILVVTNERYKHLVLEQLPDLKPEQVLCEPHMRNTAPCVLYSAFWIAEREPDANIIVAPSDHLILKNDEFLDTIRTSIRQAHESGNLVTLGIKPTRPDTGYGYIQWADQKDAFHETVKRVKTFTEKPSLELAKDFLESGDFYWNSGIFIWSLHAIMNAFEIHLPEMYRTFAEGQGVYGTPQEEAFIERVYPACENISIDYGIMEKARNVNVVLSDFGWSDPARGVHCIPISLRIPTKTELLERTWCSTTAPTMWSTFPTANSPCYTASTATSWSIPMIFCWSVKRKTSRRSSSS